MIQIARSEGMPSPKNTDTAYDIERELVDFYRNKLEETLSVKYGGEWSSKVTSGDSSLLFVKN